MTVGWFVKALSQYADFRTRARRAEYWWFVVVAGLVVYSADAFAAVVVWDAIDFTEATVDVDAISAWGWTALAAAVLVAAALAVPYLAVSVRRMHDTDRSGLWVLFLLFLPIVVFILAMLDGEPRPNRWGEDPKHLER